MQEDAHPDTASTILLVPFYGGATAHLIDNTNSSANTVPIWAFSLEQLPRLNL